MNPIAYSAHLSVPRERRDPEAVAVTALVQCDVRAEVRVYLA